MYPNETDLVKACLKGNQEAWEELVDRFTNLVFYIALGYGLTRPDAEEIHQIVFIIVFRELRKLREHQALAGWIGTITSRESIRLSKKNQSRNQVELTDEDTQVPYLGPGMPSVEAIQDWERALLVKEALKRLGSPCQELLTILFTEDPVPSYEEIARRLKMPIGSIGPSRGRCLKRLEAILIELGVDKDF